MKKKLLGVLLCFVVMLDVVSQNNVGELTVNLSFSEKIKSLTKSKGRLYVFLAENEKPQPRLQTFPNPMSLNHIFATNFSNLNPNQLLVLNNTLPWSKTINWSLNSVPKGEYFLQVLWGQNLDKSRTDAPGNLFSKPQKITVNGKHTVTVEIDQIVTERRVITHKQVKEIKFQSKVLSEWWNKPMYLKASVLLPLNYKSGKSYPIRYNVAGYGGRYTRVNSIVRNGEFMDWWNSEKSPEIINVFLDGDGPFGDSYQMDSENSGPYGKALIYELIPFIESKYRGTSNALTRFVDGCSTGGWVSLGLQLYYPDHFNGAFSYSPDAIEFENYQLINIYEDKNIFVNEFGFPRPFARFIDGEPFLSMKKFIEFENVFASSNTYLNSGGQFGSHTALYSPKGEDGLPKPLFDAETGEIDKSVSEHWKKYDFKIYARKNWDTLGPKLKGKIFIWMGDMDHFYLNSSAREFSEFMSNTENPKSDAEIIFDPLEGHCSKFSHRIVLEQIQDKLKNIKEY